MSLSFNPEPSPRELAISEILRDVFGPDPQVPLNTSVDYDVDASLLNLMLEANPSEDHVVDYLRGHEANPRPDQVRLATLRLLGLLADS